MRPLLPLYAAAAATHAADQLALAAIPLTAVLGFNAGPTTVGTLVALQSAAWLLVSLPGGVLVDRLPRGPILLMSQGLGAGALGLAAIAVLLGYLPLLGGAVFLAATGTVLFVLTANSVTPTMVPRAALTTTNARIELCRATMTLLAPIVCVQLIRFWSPAAPYFLAAAMASIAILAIRRLDIPQIVPSTEARPSLAKTLLEGALFVQRDPKLRAISLCAIFWNFAFFALLAIYLPFALRNLGLDASQASLAQSTLGAGLVVGALTAARILRLLPINLVLIGGPGVSAAAAGLMLSAGNAWGVWLPAFSFFLIGFGPMLWLVAQTSVRQLVTPTLLLGRVNGVIQSAIYGVRPIGALAGGALAGWAGLDAAMAMVMIAFALSLSVSVFSPLARMRVLPQSVSPSPMLAQPAE